MPSADELDPTDPPVIDRLRAGYFGCPPPPSNAVFPADVRSNAVLAWTMALDAARRGSFVYMPKVFEIYDPAGNHILNRQCVVLIGDAGPDDCFEPIVKELREPANPLDYDVDINLSFALSIRGRIGDVPLMLETFQRNTDVGDADIIPVHISSILVENPDDLPGPEDWPSIDRYSEAVTTLYRELVQVHGSDDALLLGGKLFGVVSMARRILAALNQPYFPPNLRRKFEASTGIDCSGFYRNEILQPLDASAIVEGFLESPAVDMYQQGVRYFFGHRIPGLSAPRATQR